MPNRPTKPFSALNRKVRMLKGKKAPLLIKRTMGRPVNSLNALREPGDFFIFPRTDDPRIKDIYEIAYLLPGHEKPSGMILKRVPDVTKAAQAADHVWNWDGNAQRPTVNPSIESEAGSTRWHGYLVNGQFVQTPPPTPA